jgi:iron complex outermembrane receptor protein/vitamin B12 transporter
LRARPCRVLPPVLASILLVLFAAVCSAASIHGVVSDATGAKVTAAGIALVSKGQVVSTSVSGSDGSFQITTGGSGRFFLVVSANSFRQLQTPDFYAGQFDSIERNVVLEPEWVRNRKPVPPLPSSALSTSGSVKTW